MLNTKYHILYTFCFLGILFLFLFIPIKASASSLSLGIYPPVIKIQAFPEDHLVKELTVSNYSDKPANLSVVFKNFTGSDKDNGEISFVTPDTEVKNFFSDNLKILDNTRPINQILLSPHEHRSLTIDITIPKDAKDSDYYISILFITNNRTKVQTNASYVSEGIGANLLLSVLKNPPDDEGYITNFTTPSFAAHGPVAFSLDVTNQTNHFFPVKGSLSINNVFFNTKDIITIPSTIILAHSSRFLSNDPSTALDKIIWQKNFLFGLYRADLVLQMGESPVKFQRTIYFYSYPLYAILISFICIIFIGIISFKIIKKRGQ